MSPKPHKKPTKQDYMQHRRASQWTPGPIPPTCTVRMFPNPYTKKPVNITVLRHWGIGVHYWVIMHEGENPLWNPDKRVWTKYYDNKESGGQCLSKQCKTVVAAERWVAKMLKTEFPAETHEPEHEVTDVPWCYGEGD